MKVLPDDLRMAAFKYRRNNPLSVSHSTAADYLEECADDIETLTRQRDELLAAAKTVASIAHCGGLSGMSESDALIAIRKATLAHFDTGATDAKHRDAIDAARGKS